MLWGLIPAGLELTWAVLLSFCLHWPLVKQWDMLIKTTLVCNHRTEESDGSLPQLVSTFLITVRLRICTWSQQTSRRLCCWGWLPSRNTLPWPAGKKKSQLGLHCRSPVVRCEVHTFVIPDPQRGSGSQHGPNIGSASGGPRGTSWDCLPWACRGRQCTSWP